MGKLVLIEGRREVNLALQLCFSLFEDVNHLVDTIMMFHISHIEFFWAFGALLRTMGEGIRPGLTMLTFEHYGRQ